MKKVKYILVLLVFVIMAIGTYAEDNHKNNKSQKSAKTITSGCLPASSETNLDLNNVRALILANGELWEGSDSKAHYEIPKGSKKSSMYAGSIWVGGVDINGQLRTCARTFRGGSSGNDFWPGPLIATGDGIASISPEVCTIFDKHYKITRKEVEKFVEYTNANAETKDELFSDYSIPKIILDWPAHGPTEYGAYDHFLAPFYDVDGDNSYNPTNGDYPYFDFDKDAPCNYQPERRAENLGNTSQKLFGDMTIWWVYNDKGNVHTTSIGAAAIGMEFRAQAFAFSTNDELNNMTFYNYQIINRSTYSLTDAYFGVWNDPDLGYARDDAAGCDVIRGLGYVFNDKEEDGNGLPEHYGFHPPAIGVDFFEGPYQDPDGKDNPTSWKDFERTQLDCENGYLLNLENTGENTPTGEPGDIFNGNINGLNFGDTIVDNERWGMRRFVFYINSSPLGYNKDPNTALEYYQYLKGYWIDGTRMTYGGSGYGGSQAADFMFPKNSDECGWGTNGIKQVKWDIDDNDDISEGADFRIVQSAGPFILEPGAVNDITIGVVWARANSTAWASVEEVRKADMKAQRLFENCFRLIDGPDAPEMDIVEIDGKLIFHIWNKKGSNNYLEQYRELDPFIDPTAEDKYYNFQGYQVFQLKDKTVTMGEITDENKARQVFQCDIKDGITQIVNYVWDNDLGAAHPVERVNGLDEGIVHSFELTEDAFSKGSSKELINYSEYYYVAVAYAHNDFNHYNSVDEGALGNQTKPYLAGRNNIRVKTAMPNSTDALNGGTKLNSEFGDVPVITVIEGKGNGDNIIDLTDETIENILSKTGYPFKADELVYKKNFGPVNVKVIDPINVIDADFTLRLIKDSINVNDGDNNYIKGTGLIRNTKWELFYELDGETHYYYSDSWITYADEKLIPELGLSVTIEQINFPGKVRPKFPEKDNKNNGFQTAETTYKEDLPPWLSFVANIDGKTPYNWIRTGKQTVADEDTVNWADYIGVDPEQVYEKILNGTWAPYKFTSGIQYGNLNPKSNPVSTEFDVYRLPSVNIVITKNKDLWTRCPVIEMAENDYGGNSNSLSEGGALRFHLREAPSKNKEGVSGSMNDSDDNSNVDASNYIGAVGMSWFPGYAIDVETGERLNMMFGEDSWLVGENGNDMLWNPTSKLGNGLFEGSGGAFGMPYFGGKHYIYVVGHNDTSEFLAVGSEKFSLTMPSYDMGKTLYDNLKKLRESSGVPNNYKSKWESLIWKHCAWTSIPMTMPGSEYWDLESMPDNELSIKLRISNPYMVNIGRSEVENPVNDNFPSYSFSTSELRSEKGNENGYGSSALDKVNIVPNPYYGASQYETNQLDNTAKIINLPERCIVSIYNSNGGLIRKFDKDNSNSYIVWDLKNQYGISIASGMYIIHIKSPELGEKIIKWFGSLRPIDLNAF